MDVVFPECFIITITSIIFYYLLPYLYILHLPFQYNVMYNNNINYIIMMVIIIITSYNDEVIEAV